MPGSCTWVTHLTLGFGITHLDTFLTAGSNHSHISPGQWRQVDSSRRKSQPSGCTWGAFIWFWQQSWFTPQYKIGFDGSVMEVAPLPIPTMAACAASLPGKIPIYKFYRRDLNGENRGRLHCGRRGRKPPSLRLCCEVLSVKRILSSIYPPCLPSSDLFKLGMMQMEKSLNWAS